jgi:hypothetical protein
MDMGKGSQSPSCITQALRASTIIEILPCSCQ